MTIYYGSELDENTDQGVRGDDDVIVFPVSFAQQRLWFLEQLTPGTGVYNIPLAVRLTGKLNLTALEQTLTEIVRRHETLRTSFNVIDSQPVQVISDPLPFNLPFTDLSDLERSEREQMVHRLAEEEAARPFDLTIAPLLRAHLLRLSDEEHVLLVTMHHIISDGWSMSVLIREVAELYRAFSRDEASPLEELPVQYADYAVWQREWLQGSVLAEQLSYWREQLRGAPSVLELPTDRPRPAVQSNRGGAVKVEIGAETTAGLKELSRKENVTIFMVLLAAFDVLLWRWSGQEDVVVGTPIANRTRAEVEGLIGFFVNTLALRVRVGGNARFVELLRQVKEVCLGAYAHQELPFEKLVEELEPERTMSHSPVFQVLLALHNAPREELELPELKLSLVGGETGSVKFDLSLTLSETGSGLLGSLEFNSDLFERATIERMAGHLQVLLNSIVTNPQQVIAALPLLTTAEREQLLHQWNEPRMEYRAQCIHEQFAAQVEQAPDAIALVHEDERLSYRELNERANQLAHYLQTLGVGPESVVGVMLERSAEMVITLLAVLKAGGAYLPLDPDYPQERLRFMLADAAVTVLITTEGLRERVGEQQARVVCLDQERMKIATYSAENPRSEVSADNLAYVIYTSGSTGKPKGVMVSHGNVARLFSATEEWFHFNGDDVWTLFHSYAFDFSVWEMWGALLYGGRLVVVDYMVSRSPESFYELLVRDGVTVLNQTPSAFRQLMRAEAEAVEKEASALRLVIFGGEALDVKSLQPWFARHRDRSPQLVNMYGITETTVHVTDREVVAADAEAGSGSVVGVRIPDLELYVLDEQMQLVPVGVTGEIYVGGAGVARGYLQRPELTAERFVPHPYSSTLGARLYRSGDLARYLADGQVEYVGRSDEQVKIRGHRIELGEVEAALSGHAGVSECAVVARAEASGDKRLVAYLSGRAEQLPTITELRAHLKEQLPEYLMPSAFVFLEKLPLTASGKVDRRALPVPDATRPDLDHGYIAPQSETETLLASMWAAVLQVDRVGLNDNFFELGGDSILSLQVIAKAREAGLPITPRLIFQHQTIAELAAVVAATEPSATLLAEQGLVTGVAPLTPIQHWFFEQELAAPHHFNQSLLLRVERGTEPSLLAEAIRQLVSHHDALRLRFSRDDAGWRQEHAPSIEDVSWSYVDLSQSREDEQATLIERTATELQQEFHLDEAPLLTTAFFDPGPERAGRLLIIIHHLVVDAVSWRILLGDLQTAYQQLKRGPAAKLPVKTTSYKQWAIRLTEHAASDSLANEAAYWLDERRRLIRPLPLDYPDGNNDVASARSVNVTLPEPETRALLQEVPAAYHTQINDVLLGAMAQAIYMWTKEPRVLVDIEGHGREDLGDGTDVSRTVGWFTSIFPVLLEVDKDFGPGDLLKACKETLRAIPQRGLGYGLLRYLADGEIGEQLRELPPAQISFNYLGQFDQALEPSGMLAAAQESIGRLRSPLGKRSHVLELSGNISEGRLQLWWNYSEHLHSRTTIERVAASFIEILKGIIVHCQSTEAGGYTPSDFPLAQLTQQKLDRLVATVPRIESIYPLSPMQQGMLFHSLYSEQQGVYSIQLTCSIEGDLDATVLERAWHEVVKRHATLRTSFHWPDLEYPLQVAHQGVELPIKQYDWQQLSQQEQQRQFELFLNEEHNRGFDLSTAPLMRLALIKLAENSYYFVWSHHHLLLDGWSIPLLLKEVFAFYATLSHKHDLKLKSPRPYRDYIAWLQQQDTTKAEAFWRRALAGLTGPTTLNVGKGNDDSQADEPEFQRQLLHLSANTTRRLQSFARQHQLTLNTLLQGAWALLLSKYTGARDVVFGATTSGRPPDLPDSASMVGLFINTLPVRVQLPAEERLLPWLKNLQAQQSEARQYEYSSLMDVQKWSDIPKNQPLFESILVLENYPIDTTLQTQQMNLNLEVRDIQSIGQTNYPLNIVTVPGEELLLRAGYDGRRFSDATIRRMLGHFQVMLENLITNSEQRLSQLSLLSAEERQQLLVQWNDTAHDVPENECIQHLFEAQVERTPEAIAVVCDGTSLTYQELNRRANQLAHRLREMGVGPHTLVGICVERSPEMVIGLLGILKAGGAYVPLDPKYPKERLTWMLEDAKLKVLITSQETGSLLPPHDVREVRIDVDQPVSNDQSDLNPATIGTPDDLAYVIFTSGSTGRPKAAGVYHRGFVNLLEWFITEFGLTADDSFLLITALSFDLTQKNVFAPLCVGARLCISEAELYEAARIVETIQQQKITRLNCTPSGFYLLLDAAESANNKQLSTLRTLFLGGEPISVSMLKMFCASNNCQTEIVNTYGPTECTDICAYYRMRARDLVERESLPTGQPVYNVALFVLNDTGEPTPIGVEGEIHIAGAGVGAGYINDSALTSEKFIPHPFSEVAGARLYRTGDLARYLPDGNLEYLGRMDHQVKVRGFRIELGEIEAALRKYPAVRETVVVARANEAGAQRLVAYIVAHNSAVNATELRRHLKEQLADYMVPQEFVLIDQMPLTPSGKVDRRALPAPGAERPELERGYVEPRTELERWLVKIWEPVLGVDGVGVEDNFFELGGDSIRAAVLINRLQEELNEYVYVVALFDAPTVAELASYLNTHYPDAVAKIFATEQIEPASRDEALDDSRRNIAARKLSKIGHAERALPLPLSFAQQRLWFLDQLGYGSSTYNIPLVLRLSGHLDVAVMERALNEVVRRHESLRTSFTVADKQPAQLIHDSLSIALRVVDLTNLNDVDRQQRALELAKEEASRPFDLTRAPLLRVQLLKLDSSEHLCLLTMHHIISDGWSLGVLVKEFGTIYEAYLDGRESPLPELPIQYADYAVWQREWLQGEVLEQQLSYWKEQLTGAPSVLELPTDRPRPAVQTYRGGQHGFVLLLELLEGLKLLSQQYGTTLFMTVLAAFQSLLSRYSHQTDIVVGTPIAGRTRAEVEGLIGFFVNTLALRTDLRGDPIFSQSLLRVREVCLGAYAHQELPFEKLVEELEPERTMSHSPVFQVLLALQNAPREELELPGVKLDLVDHEATTVKFDLSLTLSETGSGLLGSLEFNSDLFERATIERMAGHFRTLLESVVENAEQRLTDLPLLTAPERQQLLHEWNDTQREYPSTYIHELFAAQVERTPDAIALVFEEERLSYRQLNARANQLAHQLQALGVGPESLVAVMLERSAEMVMSVLAVLKAGGAYLPLDPEYPQERLSFVLEDASASVLITTTRLLERVGERRARTVCLDAEWTSIAAHSAENPQSELQPDNLAYVIYTSGSTGTPKGAMNTHRALSNRLLWMQEKYSLRVDDIVLQKTPFSFDVSVWELFWPLITGAQLVVARAGGHRDPQYLRDVIERAGVTTLHFVPSMLGAFVDVTEVEQQCGSVRRVISSGEALPVELAERFYNRFREAELHNLYGPTEAAIDVTWWKCERESERGSVPIGQPIANTQVYILDEVMRAVPVGVSGELYIGGVAVGRGYVARAEMTAERYVPDPFSVEGGGRLYRTGDVCRWAADGQVEYVGRMDHQVKVRGFRIELGEVEAALRRHPSVQDAVVLARPDQAGDQRLLAYVVAHNSAVNTTELRRHLKEQLPEYMIPQSFVQMDQIPLTSSGKVDRRALPAPEAGRPELEKKHVGARNELERWLIELWERVVGVEGIGVHDNFFELGGDSIKGAVLIHKLQEEFNTQVRVVALFNAPTIAELAAYLNANFPEDVFRGSGTATPSSEQVDELSAEQILEIRKVIRPLPPLPLSSAPRNPSAIFVLSPPRSGSTLLRVMLGGHPELFAPPELELLSFNTLAERSAALSGRYSFWQEGTLRALMQVKGCTADEAKALMREYEEQEMTTREFYRRLQEWIPGKRLVDKTPSYALDEQVLQSAEVQFENALYIYLVRHPQAMIRSFVEAHLDQVFFRYEHELDARELAEALWVISHENIRKFLARVPEERQHTVRFEELVKTPEQTIRKICDFLGIEPVSEMLEPYKGTDQRMTDGITPLSKMLGDVKFHEHQRIEPEVADRWKQNGKARLSVLTWGLAESLGYQREDQPQPKLSQHKKSAPDHFVPIQPRGVQPPLFCVHAVGGHVYSYASLARCLGEDQPFYGIQSPSLLDQRQPFTTIREMAACYAEDLLSVQPRGPYLLAGHSSGGQVAFEMAQTLLQRGQRVDLLALFDTDAVSIELKERREEIKNQDDAMLLAEVLQKNLPLSFEQLQQLNSEERLRYIIDLAKQHNLVPPEFQLAQASLFLRTLRANLLASADYVPEKYAGHITLFRASERVMPAVPHGETLGWGSVAAGGVELHVVPGNHVTMMAQPNVQVVAELLKTHIQNVQRGGFAKKVSNTGLP